MILVVVIPLRRYRNMDKIQNLSGDTSHWIQIDLIQREFELRSEERLFGKLKWERSRCSPATAIAADGEWTFNRTGLLLPSFSVCIAGSGKKIAILKTNLSSSGTLRFETGQKLSWSSKNFWRSEWGFNDIIGEILRIRLKPGLLKLKADVEIIRDLGELSLLACLGMYLLVLMHDNSTVAAASMMPFVH